MTSDMREPDARPRVVIIGGGFGGLAVARHLRGVACRVTLIDRSNHHLFQPLLYQVATGLLSPANIAVPLRRLLRGQDNAQVLLAEVEEIDLDRREVRGTDLVVPYDILVVATGVRHDYFGQDWERDAPGLKTIADATAIRRRVLRAFEAAELAADPEDRAGWLTFVVIGGGPTGVELAGTLAELSRTTLRGEFRRINPSRARILLVERAPDVLPTYPSPLAARARDALARLGVEVRTGTGLVDLQPDCVTLERTETAEREQVPTHTVIWAAGVRASRLGRVVAQAAGLEVDRQRRVPVTPQLTVPGHPEVFVIGDLAAAPGADGRPLPGLAAVAMQQGRYVARAITGRLRGRVAPPFRYRNLGSMAVVGRGFAVADLGLIRLWGFAGWVAWALLHLARIVEFENRVLVFVQWIWSYLTSRRPARLITDAPRRDP